MNKKHFFGGLAGCILSGAILIRGGIESFLSLKKTEQIMQIPQVSELVQIENYLIPLHYKSHIGDINYNPKKKAEVHEWIKKQRPEMQNGYAVLLRRYEKLVKAGALEIRNEITPAYNILGFPFLVTFGFLGTLYSGTKARNSFHNM
ncbi:hypothetical protein HYW75_05705 [Candidatus Pacearchaeota archaeon]|nr:hypothetical protein [Candidatus Pacearchaeota archaeon]